MTLPSTFAPAEPPEWPRLQTFARYAFGMGLVYFAAARFSLLLVAEPEGIAVFWPASGVAAGVLIAAGPRARPGIVAGVVAGTLAANLLTGKALPVALVFAAANAAECLVAAYILRQFQSAPPGLTSIRNVIALFAAAAVASLLCALPGAHALSILGYGGPSVLEVASLWARSDASGIISVAPFIIEVSSFTTLKRMNRREFAEGMLAVGLLAAAALIVIANVSSEYILARVIADAVLLPILVWIAGRTPRVFAAAATMVISFVIAGSMVAGIGLFMASGESLHTRVTSAQLSILTVAFCTLVLSAMFAVQRLQRDVERRLLAQLDHRVKNVLALVLATIDRSTDGRAPTSALLADMKGRIHALAAMHARLSTRTFEGAQLSDVARDALASYKSDSHTAISGPDIFLTARASQAIAIVLHELVSNAAKYGALSTPHGSVRFTWRLDPAGAGRPPTLVMTWREAGGPPVSAPARESYGLATIRGLLRYEFGAEVHIAFPSEGLVCTFRMCAATVSALATEKHRA